MARAFAGAYGAFCVTNFWEHFSPEKEKQQARTMAEAAKQAGLKHVIWSTLDDTRERVPLDDDRMPTLMERYKVLHFYVKGEADAYFREAGAPTTFLRTSFYWDNLIYFGMGPERGEDGVLHLTLPLGDKELPGIAAEDISRCAYGIFKEGPGLAGQTIGIAGGHATGEEMATGLSRALGETVLYQDVSPTTYRSFGFPGTEDLGNMFQYKQEFEADYCGERSRALDPALQSFDDRARANARRILLEAATG